MRKENHFHEEIVECIYKRLYDAMPGVDILVAALYTRRGGIDINPIRATQVGMLKSFSNYIDINKISYKTLNQ
jgi:7-cyano-7-deazaguanine reductase